MFAKPEVRRQHNVSAQTQTDTQAKILISYLGVRASVVEHRVGFPVEGMIAEVRELTEDIHVPDAEHAPHEGAGRTGTPQCALLSIKRTAQSLKIVEVAAHNVPGKLVVGVEDPVGRRRPNISARVAIGPPECRC